jgi:hypothetical protein
MDRTMVRRGLAALALALVLTLAGAQPVAAAEPGFWGSLDRLLGLWEEDDFFGNLWEGLGNWFTKAEDDGQQIDPERGFGIDPNGYRLEGVSEPAAPRG